MILILAFLAALAGFALLLLALPKHQQDWLRRKLPQPRNRLLRGIGFALIALAFVLTGWGAGWAYGTVLWCGCLTAAAASVVTLNINREAILRRFQR